MVTQGGHPIQWACKVAVRGMVDLFGEEMLRKNGLTVEESLFVFSKGPSALGQMDGVK